MLKRVLIANRGEIACRIIRSCKRLGIETVAVYSDADRDSLHRKSADAAAYIGDSSPSASYLNQNRLLEVARDHKCDSVHPGYGFLSENGHFAASAEKQGLIFIGPRPETITILGDKVKSKEIAKGLKIPLSPEVEAGELGAFRLSHIDEFLKATKLPVIVKAAAGGGGRGMRKIFDRAELEPALESASREAKASFGDGRVFVEKLIQQARHIEVQIAGDNFGSVQTIFDRDCTMQRRHQKVIEEAPAPKIPQKLRAAIHDSALKLCKEVGYRNFGTVEFLLDSSGAYYFLEVNSRLQVEHPVTEAISGLDLVELQMRIASGEKLKDLPAPPKQPQGHAIELRLCAEIPESNFLAASGKLDRLTFPKDLRVDTGYEEKDTVPHQYDSLLAKLIAVGDTREQAIEAAISGTNDTLVVGVQTNIAFLDALLLSPEFREVSHDISLAESFVAKYSPGFHLTAASAFVLIESLKQDPLDSFSGLSGFRIQGPGTSRLNLSAGERTSFLEWNEPSRNNYIFKGFDTECQLKLTRVCSNTEIEFTSSNCAGVQHAKLISSSSGTWIKLPQGALPISIPLEKLRRSGSDASAHVSEIRSPFPGKIVSVAVKEGDTVQSGDALLVMESMKMEHPLRAPSPSAIKAVKVAPGDTVEAKKLLIQLTAL